MANKSYSEIKELKWCPETDLNRRHADFQSYHLHCFYTIISQMCCTMLHLQAMHVALMPIHQLRYQMGTGVHIRQQ